MNVCKKICIWAGRKLGVANRSGMEMVQVAILVAIAVALGLVFKSQIGSFVDNTFQSLANAKF